MEMLEMGLLEVQLQYVQTAAWCYDWRVMGDVRGKVHIPSFLSCVWNHIPEATCSLSFVCDCLMCKACYSWAVWQRLSHLRWLMEVKKKLTAISGIRRNMAEVKKIRIN